MWPHVTESTCTMEVSRAQDGSVILSVVTKGITTNRHILSPELANWLAGELWRAAYAPEDRTTSALPEKR